MAAERWQRWHRTVTGNRLGRTGLGILALFLAVAVFAPQVAPYDPAQRVGRPFEPPSLRHLLGTNDIGQDILSEIVWGTRISLLIGTLAALVAVVLGTAIGVVAGYFGGAVDALLMRLADIVLTVPFLPLMILLAAYLGSTLWNIVIVISALIWASPARVIRSQVLTLKTRGYVEAAVSAGASDWYVLLRHILPSVTPLGLSQFILAAKNTILIEASLSFLGLGDPTEKSWGTVLYYAQVRSAFLSGSWLWWVVPPGLLITLAVLGFAFVGHALEEVANPRLKGHSRSRIGEISHFARAREAGSVGEGRTGIPAT